MRIVRLPGVKENDSYLIPTDHLTEEQIAFFKSDTEEFERRWKEAEEA